MSKTQRSEAVNIMVRHRQQQYHLIRIDLSEEQYNHNVAKAIYTSYKRYRGVVWNLFSLKSLCRADYVKVTCLRGFDSASTDAASSLHNTLKS